MDSSPVLDLRRQKIGFQRPEECGANLSPDVKIPRASKLSRLMRRRPTQAPSTEAPAQLERIGGRRREKGSHFELSHLGRHNVV